MYIFCNFRCAAVMFHSYCGGSSLIVWIIPFFKLSEIEVMILGTPKQEVEQKSKWFCAEIDERGG